MKSFTKKLCIVNVIFYLFYPRGTPPPIPQEHPPPGGDFTTFLENRPPYTRRKDQYRGKLTPPREVLREPPRGGGLRGGVKSRKTLGISAKTYRDPPLLAMFSWCLIPFSGYPAHLPDPGVLRGGGKGPFRVKNVLLRG